MTALRTALLMSRGSNPAPWEGTAWPHGTFNVEDPFAFSYPTTDELVADLREYAHDPTVYSSREGLVLSYATHLNLAAGGRKDSDCGRITALVLDADKPPLPADPQPIADALAAARVAHVVVRKPSGKFHVLIQLKHITARPDDGAWKAERRERFEHTINVFAEFLGRELDVHMSQGLMRAVNGYHRRAEGDPAVYIKGSEGLPLDLYQFSNLTGFVPKKVASAAALADRSAVTAPSDGRTHEQVAAELRVKLERYKKADDLKTALRAVLKGEPFAAPGGRDPMLLRICNQIAICEPFADPDLLAQVLGPSLDAMTALNPQDPPPDLDDAAYKISRGQDYGQRRHTAEVAGATNMLAALRRAIG